MIARKYELARLQGDFYRDQYRRLLWWLLASVFVILALMLAIIFLFLFHPSQRYYANTASGQIIPMTEFYTKVQPKK